MAFTGGTLTSPLKFADGSITSPGAYFGTDYGWFYDTVNNGIGLAFGGAQTSWFTSHAIHMEPAGNVLTEIAIVGESGTRFAAIRFSNDTIGSILGAAKGRGTIASKAVPQTGDQLGDVHFGGYDGLSTTNGFVLRAILLETNPVGSAAMGGRLQFLPTPIGSGTPTLAGTFDYNNGLQLVLPPADGVSIVNGQATTQGAATTSPGWYAQIISDTVPRVCVGLNASDGASISFGSGALSRDAFIERVGAASLRLGSNDSAAPVIQTFSVQSVAAGTTDTAGAIWNFSDSIGTGTGQSGGYRWRLHPKSATSGSTQNAFSTAMTLQNHASNVPGLFLSVALFSGGTTTSTVPNFTIQPPLASAVTSWSTSGTFFGINSASGFAGNFMDFHLNGGASLFKVDSAGSIFGAALTVSNGTQMIVSTSAFANGAAASTATLTNAPAAGNPTKWIPISDNGTTRYIPAW